MNRSNLVFEVVESLIRQGIILHTSSISCGKHHIYAYACTDKRGSVLRFGSAEQVAEWWIASQSDRISDLFWAIQDGIDKKSFAS